MENKNLNTMVEFEFADGSKTELTLSFHKLYQLKTKNEGVYNKYCSIIRKKAQDELDSISILYTGYICAHMGEKDLLTEEEFMILCGSDRVAVNRASYQLTCPKKQKTSVKPL